MSRIKKIVLAACAALAISIPIGLTSFANAANAATPSCGPNCVEPFSHEWGRHMVMDAIGGGFGVQHQKVVLFRSSHDDGAEDFTYSAQGTVPQLVADGLLPAIDLVHYSGDSGFEVEYTPFGVDSGLCVGTWLTHPVPGNLLRLEPCGVAANTVWIVDHFGTDGNDPHFGNIIAGTTTNFSHPLVWAYPAGSTPFDIPRPTVTVRPLIGFSTGQHPSAEQWGARTGVTP